METPCLMSLPDVVAHPHTECRWQRPLQLERAAHRELADADHRKDEFLAMLGHELRNPLSAIVSAIQVLEQHSHIDPADSEMYSVIKRQSLHMTKLLDDLLDISRITCGKILLHIERLDLVALARNAVADHQHHLDAARQTLVLELPDAPMWVAGDATRLVQVITNLLHNATKFTNPFGTIWVRLHGDGTSVEVNVRDTGIGIAPTDLAAMFEPFRQAEASRVRSRGGLGLGLALARRLVEKHNGAITAFSEGLGCGSIFSIRLPLSREGLPERSKLGTQALARS